MFRLQSKRRAMVRGAIVVAAPNVAAGLVISTVPAGASAPFDEDLEPVRVGLLHSLTGPAGPFGISESDGARVVLEAANAAGGAGGREIEIFIADDASDPTQAARSATELINQDRVHVIIGPTIGGNTLAVAPIAAAAEVPVLPNNGTISVTSKDNDFWPWIFRSGPSDLVTIESLLERVLATGATRIGVFAQEDAYGSDSLEFLEGLIDESGTDAEIVEVARAPLTATDLTPHATRLRNADPEAVIMIVSPPTVSGALVRAFSQVGLEATIWAPIGTAQQAFIDAAGEAANGVHTVGMSFWADPSPDEQRLVDLLEADGLEPVAFEVAGAYGADALVAAVASIDTPEIDGAAIKTALESTCVDSFDPGPEFCYTAEERDGPGIESLVPLIVVDGEFVRDEG